MLTRCLWRPLSEWHAICAFARLYDSLVRGVSQSSVPCVERYVCLGRLLVEHVELNASCPDADCVAVFVQNAHVLFDASAVDGPCVDGLPDGQQARLQIWDD